MDWDVGYCTVCTMQDLIYRLNRFIEEEIYSSFLNYQSDGVSFRRAELCHRRRSNTFARHASTDNWVLTGYLRELGIRERRAPFAKIRNKSPVGLECQWRAQKAVYYNHLQLTHLNLHKKSHFYSHPHHPFICKNQPNVPSARVQQSGGEFKTLLQ